MTSARAPVSFTVRARTDLGRTRDHNEDAFLVADLGARSTDLTNGGPHKVGERGTLFLVADGMGGAAAGELASSMAADLIFRHLLERASTSPQADAEQFAQQLRDAVEEANEHIHAYSKDHPDVRGMGTTATVAGVLQGTLYLAQVGDSRGYLVRDGVATQLTKDQSLMQRLVDAGELTEEEAEQSERRNIILQALGPDAKIRVDLSWQELRRGDVLVICSDGLSGQVKREEIAALVEQQPDLDALCDQLIMLANERGGPDNITVVAVRFDGDGLPPAGSSGEVGYRTMLNQETSETPAAIPARPPEPVVPPAENPPPPVVPAPPAPKRSGSPAAVAALTFGVIVLLTIFYFLLRR
ncbi:MAG TPA: Stp1/IreP family PP2C-type Ser/Thr phosphatase [Gemmatimonadales bacterium]|jgi:protein phosphatase|nr:Stp1/IreP family PP2C-type Ser/Thr phosphatase [Gemmatimonadales bacterium]